MDLLRLLLFVTLLAVTGVLLAGVAIFGFGDGRSGRLTNLLMRWRVALQGAAVVLLALLVYLGQG